MRRAATSSLVQRRPPGPVDQKLLSPSTLGASDSAAGRGRAGQRGTSVLPLQGGGGQDSVGLRCSRSRSPRAGLLLSVPCRAGLQTPALSPAEEAFISGQVAVLLPVLWGVPRGRHRLASPSPCTQRPACLYMKGGSLRTNCG